MPRPRVTTDEHRCKQQETDQEKFKREVRRSHEQAVKKIGPPIELRWAHPPEFDELLRAGVPRMIIEAIDEEMSCGWGEEYQWNLYRPGNGDTALAVDGRYYT